MQVGNLYLLPPPLAGKTGWPWTEPTHQLPYTMPDGSTWPRISIVTPSFNQNQFIEETIRSVLLQDYPNLEYIIIDGGSTDGSVEIIKKYEPWLTYWVSEKDRGQSHAINKGFEGATGIIGGWINSDDLYLPGAFQAVATTYIDSRIIPEIISGITRIVDKQLNRIKIYEGSNFSKLTLMRKSVIPQPSTFFLLNFYRELRGLDEKYNYAFDYEFWLRASKKAQFGFISKELAVWRQYPEIKSLRMRRVQIREAIKAVFWNYQKVPRSWLSIFIGEILPNRNVENSKVLVSLYARIRELSLMVITSILKIFGWYLD